MKLKKQLQSIGSNTRSPHSPTAVYRSIIAAVINQAIYDVNGLSIDLYGNKKRIAAAQAMYFILSEDCKNFCLELEIDHEKLRDRAIHLYEDYKRKKLKPRRFKIVPLRRFKRRLGASYKPAVKL